MTMMHSLRELKELVFKANQALAKSGLVMKTFGNVSGIDRKAGLVVIKPSGVPYEEMTPDHMVPVALDTGDVIGNALRPSSDTPTHLELYRAWGCGGVVHTHSETATAFAQARRPIPCMGTTHADYFRGEIPVTRPLTQAEVEGDYEKNTGLVIVESFHTVSPDEVPAVLVANHGPFAWGKDALKAVENAELVEYLAKMEVVRRLLSPDAPAPDAFLVDKHYLRKHGKGAYYGQK
jgi:L-ribulose-5-phosphate 4-epimerase